MTTQLASQLQKLQVRVADEKRLNNSFLFDKSDAHSYSREQILQLAVHGLQSLVALDNRFHAFIEPLFDSHKVRRERGTLTSEENRALDVQLEHLLTLLSPHLFLHAAQQVFEYLVRVHEVHVYNVSAVLRAFLPYHDHNLFVRALMLLDLRDSGFGFLATNQERGAPLLREHLILACAESRKALRLLCLTMAMPVRLHIQHPAAYALFTSVACALAARPEAEAIWRVLLPYVLEFMSLTDSHAGSKSRAYDEEVEGNDFSDADGEEHAEGFVADDKPSNNNNNNNALTSTAAAPLHVQREVVCTALIVVAAWSATVKFSAAMLQAMMTPTCALLRRAGTPHTSSSHVLVPLQDLLSFVDVLFSSHGDILSQVELTGTLNTLLAMPWSQWMTQLSPVLQQQQSANSTTRGDADGPVVLFEALVSTLMNVCLDRLRVAHSIRSVSADVLVFLRCAAVQLPLPARLVRRFMRVLLTSDLSAAALPSPHTNITNTGGADGGEEEDDAFYCDVMQALERRYQHVFDRTLSAALQDSQSARAATAFLAAHLHGTRYTAVDLQGVVQHNGALLQASSLPLFACLLHSLPAVRQCGAKAIQGMSLDQLMDQGAEATTTKAGSAAGGALLELLIQVCAYEAEADVAVSFLRALAPAMMQLVQRIHALQEGGNAGADDNNTSNNDDDTRGLYELLFAQMLQGLEAMLALHCNTQTRSAEVQTAYVELICVPLMHASTGAKSPKKTAGKRSKAQAASAKDIHNHTAAAASQTRLRGLVLYHIVYSYLLLLNEEERTNVHAARDADSTTNEARHETLSHTLLQLLQADYPQLTHAGTATDADGTTPTRSKASHASSGDDEAENEEHSATHTPMEETLRALLHTPALLLALHAEAQARLPQLLQRVQTELREQHIAAAAAASTAAATSNTASSSSTSPSVQALCNVSHALLVECGLAVAACVFAELQPITTTAVAAAEKTPDSSTIAALLRFLCGDDAASPSLPDVSDFASEERQAGYLVMLQELHRRYARTSSGGTPAAVGRGAENSLLTRPFLPHNNLTTQLGHVLQAVLACESTNTRSDTARDSLTIAADGVSQVRTYTGLLQLMAHLSAPLPALALRGTSSTAMAVALMSLLDPSTTYMTNNNSNSSSSKADEKTTNKSKRKKAAMRKETRAAATLALSSQRYGIDWYALVHEAVYHTPFTHIQEDGLTMPSCTALGLVVLLPLWAPPAQRLALLRTLQDLIVHAASNATVAGTKSKKQQQQQQQKKKEAATMSSAQAIVSAALQYNSTTKDTTASFLSFVSVTSLSALVEAMAAGKTPQNEDEGEEDEGSRYTLPSHASRLLCAMLAGETGTSTTHAEKDDGDEEDEEECAALPFALATRVIEYFYALPDIASTKKKQQQQRDARAKAELDLTGLLPRVRRALQRLHAPAQADAVTSFVLAIARRLPPLRESNTLMTTSAAATTDTKAKTTTNNEEAAAATLTSAQPALQLCTVLLEQPHVRLTDGTLRPVYRPALTWLAQTLQQCSEASTSGGGSGGAARRPRGPVIFSSKRAEKANKEGGALAEGGAGLSAAFVQRTTTFLRPVLLRAMQRLGGDVTRLCVLTRGGYEAVFLPFLQDMAAQSATPKVGRETESMWFVLEEMLEMLAPHTAPGTSDSEANKAMDVWQPPVQCLARQPLRGAHAMQLVRLCAQCLSPASPEATKNINSKDNEEDGTGVKTEAERCWPCNVRSVHALRVLTTVLRAAPVIAFDEPRHTADSSSSSSDDDGEGGEQKNEKSRMTFYEFLTTLLAYFPLEALWPLLASDAAVDEEEGQGRQTFLLTRTLSEHRTMNGLYARYAFAFLGQLVHTAIAQTQALCASYAEGDVKLRQALVKQCLVLMARLLTHNTHNSNNNSSDVNGDAKEMTSSHITDTVAELLRVLAPLLTRRRKRRSARKQARNNTTEGSNSNNNNNKSEEEEEESGFLLHIPLVALLVRMEAAEYSAALRYHSAVDLCRTILLSFDVQSQMRCLAQLMHLLVDPYAALGHKTHSEKQPEDDDADDEEEEREDDVVHVLRRLLKPNQVINRQEAILNLVNTTVKASAFLSKFVALQYHSKGSEEESETGDVSGVPAVRPTRLDTSDGCMHLLVSALELYTHYTDLNASTANDLPQGEGQAEGNTKKHRATAEKKADDEKAAAAVAPLYGEQKAYVMLLELLSGNTLACVLAGINESTFVQCLLRLLRDARATLRRKGLEVLLDRLHHSLPTVEHTVSDEELARHRAALRDPKKKLTLMDLVKLKARPLTTKRSLHLFPLLTTVMQGSIQHILTAHTTCTSEEEEDDDDGAQVDAELEMQCVTAQLAIACIEELVRIVACGGSMQAEKTLLNVSRSKRLTEPLLAKLFGNKARVQAVHGCLTAWCERDLPALTQALYDAPHTKMNSSSGGVRPSVRVEAMMVLVAALCTALGTTVQVMGEAFAAPHSQALLRVLIANATQAVVRLPAPLASSTAGSLLRHTTLSCLIRVFPACWQFSQPYLPHLLFTVTHHITVQDTNTSYLGNELLTVLEALLEPQLLLEAGINCLRGVPQDVLHTTTQRKNEDLIDKKKKAKEKDGTQRPPSRAQPGVLRLRLETHSLEVFYGCVLRRVQNLKAEELAQLTVLTSGSGAHDNFWLASLQMVAHAASAPTSAIVMPILEAFTAFFVKFRAKRCTALLQLITEWAFSEGNDNNNNYGDGGDKADGKAGRGQRAKKPHKNNRNNDDDAEEEEVYDDDDDDRVVSRTRLQAWLLFYVLYNHLLDRLGPIMDFAYPVALPHLLRLLTAYCEDGSPARRLPFLSLITLCLEQALDAMRRMALAQTPGPDYDYSIPLDIYFATSEVFNGAMPALVHQLTNLVYLQDGTQDYSTRAEQSVIPAIRAFFACLNSNKLQGKTQSELLRGLRHPSRHVRRMTLRCLDGVYADGGDELAARLMAEMLPAVVELTEDRDDAVVEEARTLCMNLSRMTGQDVLHAMS